MVMSRLFLCPKVRDPGRASGRSRDRAGQISARGARFWADQRRPRHKGRAMEIDLGPAMLRAWPRAGPVVH